MDISNLWRQRRLPVVNGVIFGDGSVKLLDVEQNDGHMIVRKLGSTVLDVVMQDPRLAMTGCIVTMEKQLPDGTAVVAVGEGSWGGDGFVSVVDARNSVTKWVAVFDCSNPFIEVQIVGATVVAISNLGHRWCFPMEAPERVEIEQPPAGGRP